MLELVNIEKPDHIGRYGKVDKFLDDPKYGMSQKVDGIQCVVVIDPDDADPIKCYNKGRGLMTYSSTNASLIYPVGAQILRELGVKLVVAGEGIGGRGHWDRFHVFNIMYYDEHILIDQPWYVRESIMGRLAAALQVPFSPFPETKGGSASSLQFISTVREPHKKREYYEQLRNLKPPVEGVIFRDVEGLTADRKDGSVIKHPFVQQMDVVAYAWNPAGKGTTNGGSVKIAVYHQGEYVAIGNVRSGFTNTELLYLEEEMKHKRPVVFTAEFLGKRTVGVDLVQPRNIRIRDDKLPHECTGEQFAEVFGAKRMATLNKRLTSATVQLGIGL